jgi:hypothetical protein
MWRCNVADTRVRRSVSVVRLDIVERTDDFGMGSSGRSISGTASSGTDAASEQCRQRTEAPT